MNNFNFARAHDQYLNPPDEPEAVNCDDCGEEMEDGETCNYQWCPGKFEGDAAEMANELVEAREEVKSLMRQFNSLDKHHDSHHAATCDECGQQNIQGIRCPNCGARRKA